MPEAYLDVVGYWTEIKLSILRDYSEVYATILSQQRHIKHYSYIDGFAGIGTHISNTTGREIAGAVIYYLFFASHNSTGDKIARAIFKKYRDKGIVHGH